MARLTVKEHWDVVHEGEGRLLEALVRVAGGSSVAGLRARTVRHVKRLLGAELLARMSSYDEHLLWNVIFKRYLADVAGAKVIEVGSAPGEFLVAFSRRYGCVPYGVDYSEVGVEVNRAVFRQHGLDPENVVHADFFSDEFHDAYAGSFDVVVSRGFVEHFSDVENVIDRHVRLLAAGGRLVVSVPNLRGVNYLLTRAFHRELIPLHNLGIMDRPAFARLFERDDLEPLFCDYYGTFSFYLFNAREGSWTNVPLRLCHKAQPVLNLAFRSAFGDRGAESRLLSPSLIFVGRRR